jgi:hypothetical protein
MTEGFEKCYGWAREIFVEEKSHSAGYASAVSIDVNSAANSKEARMSASVSAG